MSSPETPPPGGDRDSVLSGVQRAGIVLVAIAVLLIAFVVIRGGDDSGSGSSASNTTQTATTSAGASSATTGTTDDSASTGDSGTGTTDDSTSGTTDDSAGGTTTGDSAGGTTTGDSTTGTTTGDSGTTDGSASETGSTPAPAQPAVRTIRVVGGQPQGGVRTLKFKKGDRIRFKVVSDVADEVHVHGYDVKKDVTAGGSVTFSFTATIEGRLEVELENAHTQIAQLEVTPS